MRELIHDSFYEVLKGYDELVVDYCLMGSDSPNQGLSSHKEALEFAMREIMEQYPWISADMDKATAEESSSETLFAFPDKPWKESNHGTTLYHVSFTSGGKIPYWYAFLEPPHGTRSIVRDGKTIRHEYDREDFEVVNHALFPEGTDELEVFEWSTNWSNYFEDGWEWWGTLCYSIYDRRMNRYAVIMASATD